MDASEESAVLSSVLTTVGSGTSVAVALATAASETLPPEAVAGLSTDAARRGPSDRNAVLRRTARLPGSEVDSLRAGPLEPPFFVSLSAINQGSRNLPSTKNPVPEFRLQLRKKGPLLCCTATIGMYGAESTDLRCIATSLTGSWSNAEGGLPPRISALQRNALVHPRSRHRHPRPAVACHWQGQTGHPTFRATPSSAATSSQGAPAHQQ